MTAQIPKAQLISADWKYFWGIKRLYYKHIMQMQYNWRASPRAKCNNIRIRQIQGHYQEQLEP